MLKKRYVKSRNIYKVSFEVPRGELPGSTEVKSVHLVGDFNNWDRQATPMKQRRGVFRVTVELEPGHEYQFRYLVNGEHWCNDWHADAYVSGDFGEQNCLAVTPSGAA
jgi:hypothetical protein